MPDISGLLALAGAVIVLAAAAWAGIRSSDRGILQKRLDEEREESANQRAIREDVEVRFAKYKAEKEAEFAKYKAETETLIATQAADNAALQRVVTGEVHWVALGQQVDEFEERTGKDLGDLKLLIAQMVALIEGKP